MRKVELVQRISEATGLTQVKAEDAVDTILAEIKSTLQEGESVILRRFGTFQVRAKRARIGRNPKTGEEADIPARRVVRFKSGNPFKTEVNGSTADEQKTSVTDDSSSPKRLARKKTAQASAKATPKRSRRTTSQS